MKALIAALLLIIPMVFMEPNAPPPQPTKVELVQREVRQYITRFDADLDVARQYKLAWAIARSCVEKGLDAKMVTRIMAQESAFRPDLVNETGDYGVMQVNYYIWKKELSLDRTRLQYDDAYNIDKATDILVKLKERYGKERRWWSRYHNGIKALRVAYEDLVLSRIAG